MPITCARVPEEDRLMLLTRLSLMVAAEADLIPEKRVAILFALSAETSNCIVSELMVTLALLKVAILSIPVIIPEAVVLRLAIFSTRLPLTCTLELTALPILMPLKVVFTEIEPGKTRMLCGVDVLPTRLFFTWVDAVTPFTKIPWNNECAGWLPLLLISNPPTWLLLTIPPVLAVLMPIIFVENSGDVVDVLTTMLPLPVVEPTIFPSAALLPPMLMLEPVMLIPVKAAEFAAVGREVIAIEATVFRLISETGAALVVCSKIPSKETLPELEAYSAAAPETSGPLPPIELFKIEYPEPPRILIPCKVEDAG